MKKFVSILLVLALTLSLFCVASAEGKKVGVILGELREQDRRRYVADKLAGKCAYEERILVKKPRKEVTNDLDSRHISREDKEENKC